MLIQQNIFLGVTIEKSFYLDIKIKQLSAKIIIRSLNFISCSNTFILYCTYSLLNILQFICIKIIRTASNNLNFLYVHVIQNTIASTQKYFISHKDLQNGPTSGGAVLNSKLVDRRCQNQSPVTLVDLAVWIFKCFIRNLHKYGG